MSIDPAFDTPFNDYGQVGSFVSPATPPSLGPLEGTLVSLPCINPDWLRLVLGCVDQLRNISSWLPTLTDTQRVALLGQVEDLRIALQMAAPCCDVAIRLQPDCVLQFSTDGGATWTDVDGWAANFANCVQSGIIPGPPLLPPGFPPNTRACNIAAFLANDIIKEAITQAINAYDHDLSLLALAGNIAAATFAFELPWTAAFIYGVYDLYQFFTAGNIADLRTAEADPVLWSDVTCAIYNAIHTDGAVTEANCAAVIANICALPYTPAVAISTICAYVTQLGCNGLRAAQVAGALTTGDCSGCGGTWCYEWDFTVSPGPFINFNAYDGVWVAGTGWTTGRTVEPFNECGIHFVLPTPHYITSFNILVTSPYESGGNARQLFIRNPVGVNIGVHDMSIFPLGPPPQEQSYPATNATVAEVAIVWRDSGLSDPPSVISKASLQGTGPNPFGADNCTF